MVAIRTPFSEETASRLLTVGVYLYGPARNVKGDPRHGVGAFRHACFQLLDTGRSLIFFGDSYYSTQLTNMKQNSTRQWQIGAIGRWLKTQLPGAALGALVSFVILYPLESYFDRPREEENIARWAAASMYQRCPARDSREAEVRINTYLDALRRAKKDGWGVPIVRDDCSIGVHWSIEVKEKFHLK